MSGGDAQGRLNRLGQKAKPEAETQVGGLSPGKQLSGSWQWRRIPSLRGEG